MLSNILFRSYTTLLNAYSVERVRYLKYTKFEKAAIIGARALQIAMGAPVIIKISKDIIDPLKIAELEFEKGVIPITVRRPTEGE